MHTALALFSKALLVSNRVKESRNLKRQTGGNHSTGLPGVRVTVGVGVVGVGVVGVGVGGV